MMSLLFCAGGGSGIGRSTCQILSREGATVVVADINLKSAEETLSLLENNADSTALTIDVTDINSIEEAYDAVLQKYKNPPSIVVNSAGIVKLGKLSDLKKEDLDKVLNVNLKVSNAIFIHYVHTFSLYNTFIPEQDMFHKFQ